MCCHICYTLDSVLQGVGKYKKHSRMQVGIDSFYGSIVSMASAVSMASMVSKASMAWKASMSTMAAKGFEGFDTLDGSDGFDGSASNAEVFLHIAFSTHQTQNPRKGAASIKSVGNLRGRAPHKLSGERGLGGRGRSPSQIFLCCTLAD